MYGTDKEGRQNFVRKCRRERDHLGDKEADGVMLKGMQKLQVSVDRASLLYITGSYGPIHTPTNSKCTRNFYEIKTNKCI
jgi:hypothetical protein